MNIIKPFVNKAYFLTHYTNQSHHQMLNKRVTHLAEESATEQNIPKVTQYELNMDDVLEHIQQQLVVNHRAYTILFNMFSLFSHNK